jgi:hypothetical protein
MAVSTIDPAGLNIGQIGGRRNLIINGAMQVAQRGTSSTGSTVRCRWRSGGLAALELGLRLGILQSIDGI